MANNSSDVWSGHLVICDNHVAEVGLYDRNIVVGWALNTEAVAIYSITGRLVSYATQGADAFSSVLMPAAVHFSVIEQDRRQEQLLLKSTRTLLFYGLFVTSVFVVFGPTLITAWVGPRFAGAVTVLRVLALPMFCYIGVKSINIILFAVGGRVYRWVALILSIDALANLGLSIALAKRWGMIGVAYGTLFTMTITMFAILPFYACHVMKMSYTHLFRKTWMPALAIAVPFVLVLFWLQRVFSPARLITFAALLIPVGVVYFGLVYFFLIHQFSTTVKGMGRLAQFARDVS